jgi:hypothetical protein
MHPVGCHKIGAKRQEETFLTDYRLKRMILQGWRSARGPGQPHHQRTMFGSTCGGRWPSSLVRTVSAAIIFVMMVDIRPLMVHTE